MEHLNTGNGEIVSELDGVNERCPLKFYTDSFDTMIQQSTALNHIIALTDPHDEKQLEEKEQQQQQQLVPCAILGSGGSSLSISTSTISSSRGFPQISSLATSIALDNKKQHSLFGRTIPSDEGTAVSGRHNQALLSALSIRIQQTRRHDTAQWTRRVRGIRGPLLGDGAFEYRKW